MQNESALFFVLSSGSIFGEARGTNKRAQNPIKLVLMYVPFYFDLN